MAPAFPRLKLVVAAAALAGALAAPASAAAALAITAPSGSTNVNTPTFSGAGALGTGTVTVTITPGNTVLSAAPTATGTWSVTSAALADGAYTATATQTASDPSPATPQFTVDTVKPVLTITGVNQNAPTDATPAVVGAAGTAAGDQGVTVEIRNAPNGGGTVVVTGAATITNGKYKYAPTQVQALAAGSYSARASQRDAAGNSTVTASLNFTVAVNHPPTADFTISPANPVEGQAVTFVSTSTDPDPGQTLKETWDLTGDGKFKDAQGPAVTVDSLTPGSHAISLRVNDSNGAKADVSKVVMVAAAPTPPAPPLPPTPPPTPPPAPTPPTTPAPVPPAVSAPAPAPTAIATALPPLLAPFPVVRLVAELTGRGIRLSALTVAAPKGARVSITCSGKGCPTKVRALRATTGVALRVRQLERRELRAGAVIKILVTSPGRIGKYTRFVVQRAGAPKRTDRCLAVNGRSPIACPGR